MTQLYVIAEGETIPQLERDVAHYIEQGYVPIGGVCARQPDQYGKLFLCQALVWPAIINKQPGQD